MTLEKQLQLRNGDVSLCVFKGKMDGKLFITFDKENAGRAIKGPLFTEEEMYELAALIQDYDEWESKVVNGKANKRLIKEFSDKENSALEEIQAAVEAVKIPITSTSDLGLLPTLHKKQAPVTTSQRNYSALDRKPYPTMPPHNRSKWHPASSHRTVTGIHSPFHPRMANPVGSRRNIAAPKPLSHSLVLAGRDAGFFDRHFCSQ